jgi:hypothetical protein
MEPRVVTYGDKEGIMSRVDPAGTDQDRALWAQLKQGARRADAGDLPSVSDAELAGWLDGRLPPDAAARVEARLAADPQTLDLALAAAGALREAKTPAPERLVARAQALVGFEAERQGGPSGGLLGWLGGWRRPFEVALVASAFLIVCVTGFSLGGGFQEAYAGERFSVFDFVAAPFADNESGFLVDQGAQQ